MPDRVVVCSYVIDCPRHDGDRIHIGEREKVVWRFSRPLSPFSEKPHMQASCQLPEARYDCPYIKMRQPYAAQEASPLEIAGRGEDVDGRYIRI